MAEESVDELNIRISADANDASRALERLAKSTDRLASSVGRATGDLKAASGDVQGVGRAASGVPTTIDGVADALRHLEGIRLDGIGTQVKNLSVGLKGLNAIKPDTRRLDEVAASVKRLGSRLSGVSMGPVGTQVRNLGSGLAALNSMDVDAGRLQAVASSVRDLSKSLSKTGIGEVGTQLKSLGSGFSALNSSDVDEGHVRAVSEALGTLMGVGGGDMGKAGQQLKAVASGFSALNSEKVNGSHVQAVASALERLLSVASGANVGNVGTQVRNLAAGFDGLNHLQVNPRTKASVQSVVEALSELSTVPKSNIGPAVSAIQRLPQALAGLESVGRVDLSPVSRAMSELNSALGDAPERVQRLASGLSSLSGRMGTMAARAASTKAGIDSAGTSMRRVGDEARAASNPVHDLYRKLCRFANVARTLTTVYSVFRMIAGAISSCLTAAGDFVESGNLAVASLGKYAESAAEYASRVQDAMGIDMGQYLSNQGTFMTLAHGFGVASDQAAYMSENLTRLSYDLASFFNMEDDEAFNKVRSGMSGETEAIKQLGFDLSQTRLQQEAYNLGIDESVSKMTQAEKAYLRYEAIMSQVSWAHGDLARTISSPNNMLRVLRQNIQTTAKAIGSALMPMLKAIVPIAVAVVKVIATLANMLAELTGGKAMTTIDFGSGGELQGAAGDAEDAIDGVGDSADKTGKKAGGAADKVKELKRELMGFDEINKFSTKSDSSGSGSGGSGSGGSGSGGGGGLSNVDLSGYDWELGDNFADGLYEQLMDFARRIGDVLAPTVDVIAGYLKQIQDQFAQVDVLGALQNAVVGVVDFVSTIVRDIARVLGPVLVAFNIPATLEVAFNFIGQLFTTLAAVLEEVGIVLGKFSETFVAPIAKVAGELVRGTLSKLTGALKDAFDFVKSNGDAVRTVIAGIGGAILGVRLYDFAGDAKAAFELVAEAVDGLRPKISEVMDVMSTCREAGYGLSDTVATVAANFGGLVKQLPKFAQSLISFVSNPTAMVVAAIGAVVAALAWWATQTDDGKRTWKDFCDTVGRVMDSAKATVGAALSRVTDALGGTADAIGRVLGAIGKLALGALAGTIRAVATVIAGVATVLARVVEFLYPIVNLVAELALGAVATVLEGINSVLGFLADTLGSVLGGIGDFVSGLLGIETAEAATADAIEGTSGALSEHDQAVQDNIQAINDYDDANGTLRRTMEQTGMSVEDLAGYLADTGQSVGDFAQSVEDYADSVVNGFDKIDTESQISLDDMVGNLQANIQTTESWSANLEKLMADTGLSSNDALVQQMIAGGPEKYARALDEIVSSSDNEQKFVEAASQYGTALTDKFSQTVGAGASSAGAAAGMLMDNVNDAVAQGGQQTVDTASSVDQQTVQQFGSHYNEAKDAGRNLAGGFGDGVREASSDATGPAREVMAAVVKALNGGDGYSRSLEAGRNVVGGYADGISSATSDATGRALEAMSAVVQALNGGTGYSQAKSAGANLMGGYRDGLNGAVRNAVTVARNAMTQVNSTLGSGTSAARTKGTQTMQGFVAGLQSGVASARAAGSSAARSAQDGMGSNYNGANSAGRNEMGGFVDGLKAGMGNQAWWKGRDAANSAADGMGSNYWGAYGSGSYFTQGFEAGIASRSSNVYWTAYRMAERANSAVRSAIRQGSPSKVMRESGKWFDLGLKVGIDDYSGKVSASARSMAEDALSMADVAGDAGREAGDAFGSGLASTLSGAERLARRALAGGAVSYSYAGSVPHGRSSAATEDVAVAQMADALTRAMVAVQPSQGASRQGRTEVVLRVGTRELARAAVDGMRELQRTGSVRFA